MNYSGTPQWGCVAFPSPSSIPRHPPTPFDMQRPSSVFISAPKRLCSARCYIASVAALGGRHVRGVRFGDDHHSPARRRTKSEAAVQTHLTGGSGKGPISVKLPEVQPVVPVRSEQARNEWDHGCMWCWLYIQPRPGQPDQKRAAPTGRGDATRMGVVPANVRAARCRIGM